jgi:CHAD domain-containing protein
MGASDVIDPRPCLARLRRHLDRARAADDAEAVHQIRVATRRLDVWLRLGGHRLLRDDLRWLRREAGVLRDLDVLVARPGLPHAVVGWLELERGEARRALAAALAAKRTGALVVTVARLPFPRLAAGREALCRLVAEAREAAPDTKRRPAEAEALHVFRRRVRRVRYAGEWLGLGTGPFPAIQDRLGLVSDLLVLDRWLARSPPGVVSTRLRVRLARELGRARADASGAVAAALEAMHVMTREEVPWSSS